MYVDLGFVNRILIYAEITRPINPIMHFVIQIQKARLLYSKYVVCAGIEGYTSFRHNSVFVLTNPRVLLIQNLTDLRHVMCHCLLFERSAMPESL